MSSAPNPIPLREIDELDRASGKLRERRSTRRFRVEDDSGSCRGTLPRACLSDEQPASSGTGDNYLVKVHVQHPALAGNDGRSALPVESVRRLCCDADAVLVVHGEDGETRLDNLLLLCSRHHRLVHEGGYRIDKDVQDRTMISVSDPFETFTTVRLGRIEPGKGARWYSKAGKKYRG